MFKITTMDDLIKNSMNILEPSPLDSSGNAREDGMKYFHVTMKNLSLFYIFIKLFDQ